MEERMKVKKAKLYIFDMDGTILDSMSVWSNLGRNYLEKEGALAPDDLEQRIEKMTMEESAAYFQSLGVDKEIPDIINGLFENIRESYRLTIPGKKEIIDIIEDLSQNTDSILCILTTSEELCARTSMERLGILSCFRDIYTGDGLGLGKRTGEIYQKVCEIYGVAPEDTVVFEDVLYAVQSAKEAGCYVYAVSDSCNQEDWVEICENADESIEPQNLVTRAVS